MLIVSIFLNLGAGLFVNKIGTSAIDSKIETKPKNLKMNGRRLILKQSLTLK